MTMKLMEVRLTFGIDTLVRILDCDGAMDLDLDRRILIFLLYRTWAMGDCSLVQLPVSPAADVASVAEARDNTRSSESANISQIVNSRNSFILGQLTWTGFWHWQVSVSRHRKDHGLGGHTATTISAPIPYWHQQCTGSIKVHLQWPLYWCVWGVVSLRVNVNITRSKCNITNKFTHCSYDEL